MINNNKEVNGSVKNKKIKAVISDMDGTLLDTERIYQKYWKMAADDLGYNISAEQLLDIRSLGHSFSKEKFFEFTGDPEASEKIRTRRRELMDPYMKTIDVPLKPHVKEALAKLKEEGFYLAIATATTNLEILEYYLESTGIKCYFDEIISAVMVKEGKPSPDIYLYACEQLGIDPKDGFAVQDSPNGVISASRAGLRVIMVPDITEPDESLKKYYEYRADDLYKAAEYIIKASE